MSTNEKYFNSDLQNILNQHITTEKYKEFKPILDEIFQRRAFEFDFPLDRMTREAQNFVTNVEKIEMISGNEFENKYGQSQSVLGVFDLNRKEIVFNKEFIEIMRKTSVNEALEDKTMDIESSVKFVKSKIGELMFKVLTHESYHAMCDKDSLEYYNQYNIPSGRYLTEIFTESAVARTTKPKREERIFHGYEITDGYENITFISNMLSHALGVSQKELVTNGLNNYKELFQFCYSKFSSSKSSNPNLPNFVELIDSLNMDIDDLKTSQTNKEGRRELIKDIYQNLFDINRLNVEQDNRDVSLKYLGEIFYRDKKLKDITAESLRVFLSFGQISENDALDVLKSLEKPGLQMDNQLLDLFEVYQRGISLDSKEYSFAKAGRLRDIVRYNDDNGEYQEYLNTSNEDRLQKLLGVAQADSNRDFFKYIKEIKKEDFEQSIQWNEDINMTLYEIYEKNKMKENRGPSFDDDDDPR